MPTVETRQVRKRMPRLGEVYAQIYDRLAATDPTEDSLSHLFSDKELRIVMGKPHSPRLLAPCLLASQPDGL